ncbi:hypothetical protein [Desulfosporosinus nitroreducens]|uniref:hypothetical protein n=1 Tax=Desulfosporosinus nitroreducens TaxID=2018668 RepID=UPI00207CB23B|nr:hypothetical protein [Desulfosporosinus nitroreducens]MCO1601051.1 hypothetical protein [Desulfosporosinus nitroreducens]
MIVVKTQRNSSLSRGSEGVSAGPLAVITEYPIVFRLPNDNSYNKYGYYLNSFKNIQKNIQAVYYIGGTAVVPDGSEDIFN